MPAYKQVAIDAEKAADAARADASRYMFESGRLRELATQTQALANEMLAMMRMMVHCTEPRAEPGVYFLLDKSGAIVYVGQSESVLFRMAGHKPKEFATVRMLRIDDAAERSRLEERLIQLFTPKLNVQQLQFNKVQPLLSGAREFPQKRGSRGS